MQTSDLQKVCAHVPVCSLSGLRKHELRHVLKNVEVENVSSVPSSSFVRVCEERFLGKITALDFAIADENFPIWLTALSPARIRHLYLLKNMQLSNYLEKIQEWGVGIQSQIT